MLQFTGCKGFGLNIGNFLELEGSFHGHIVVQETADIEGIAWFHQVGVTPCFKLVFLCQDRFHGASH